MSTSDDRKRRWATAAGAGFVALVGATPFWAVPRIEDDLTARTVDRLERGNVDLDGVKVAFRGTKGTISGISDPEDAAYVRQLSGVWGVHDLKVPLARTADAAERQGGGDAGTQAGTTAGSNADKTAEEANVAASRSLSVVYDGEFVVVRGVVSSNDQRDALLAASTAAFADYQVRNRVVVTTTATTNSKDIDALTKTFAALVVESDSASVTVAGGKVTAQGVLTEAEPSSALQSVFGEVRDQGYQVVTELRPGKVVGDPRNVALKVNTDLSGGKAVLRGTVLSAEQKDLVVKAAQAAFGSANVTDQLTITEVKDVPPASDAAANQVAGLMQAVADTGAEGSMSLTNSELTVSLTAKDPNSRFFLEAALNQAAASGLTRQGQVGARADAASAQQLEAVLNQVAALQPVVFEPSSVAILPQSEGVLNQAAQLLSQVQGVVVTVEGHTDSNGDDQYNLALSSQRAEAVVNALISRGVNPEKVRGQGFGETRPVGDNSTLAGRAANRRVVFSVQRG